jgi:hypothetical protein
MAQLVAQTGGQVLSSGRPQALASPEHSLWRVLALAALVAFLAGVAGRMLSGAAKRPGSPASPQPRALEREEDEDDGQAGTPAQEQAPTPAG